MKLDKIPLTALSGVGAKIAEKLAKLDLFNVSDLLFHLPLHYQNRTSVYPISELQDGMQVTVIGTVISCNIQMGKRRILKCVISDDTGSICMSFFNFNAAMKNNLAVGTLVKCFGQYRRSYNGFEVTHPEFRTSNFNSTVEVDQNLTPIYPTTEGLKQNTLLNLTEQALAHLEQNKIENLIPKDLLEENINLADALRYVHRPPAEANIADLESKNHPVLQRLILEELIAQQLSMLKLRSQVQTEKAQRISDQGKLKHKLLESLAFTPTNAQIRVSHEIQMDLLKGFPMMRLVQGDVGSGKTLVAAIAALSVIEAGFQVVLMAPTELLSEQHALNFKNWFEPLNIEVGQLSGKMKVMERRTQLENISSGLSKIVIGTHALFQYGVNFKNLALIIVDEQHRFGVHQRLALREKGQFDNFAPHQLTMTATPIPRTLAMTAYADLNVSVIDELPPGRIAISTIAIANDKREQIIERVYNSCKNEGRQAYWVCTLIEESEALDCQSAENTANDLQLALPDLHIGLVHGRMKAIEKQYVMDAFKNGKLDLLVATTVIEVGVDVPNASLMIIEDPQRLGLAQLHQLRGRVGRGKVASHCVLLYKKPLSKIGKRRIEVMRESSDGFYIAEQDLILRGPGEVLGTKQTGVAQFKIADLLRDQYLLPQAQKIAFELRENQINLVAPLIDRWLGDKDHYANA